MKLPFYFSGQNIGYQRFFQQTIGDCQRESEQFEASIVSYKKALELVDSSSGDENSKNINKGSIMHNMAICSQGAEAQYILSECFFGSGDREVEFTGL